jgi:hypothetical protein
MFRPIPTTPVGTPSGSQIGDRTSDACTSEPSERRWAISSEQGPPCSTPSTAATMAGAASGSRVAKDRPSTSSGAHPYSSGRRRIPVVIDPSRDTVTMASCVEDRMAA